MFDFGFSELVVIGVVLLIVVGPERLPKVARMAGHLLGRLQRYVSDVKTDIQREMQLDELKKLQQQVQQQAQDMESSVRAQVTSLESGIGDTVDAVKAAVPGTAPESPMVPPPKADDGALAAEMSAPGKDSSAEGPQLELGLDPSVRQPVPADKS